MVTVHDIEQGTPEWHAIRVQYPYTGTAAHKLLRFGTIEYTANKANDSFGGNFYTRRGHKLEDEAIDLYQEIHGTTVSQPGFVTNSKYAACGYSPDGIDGQVTNISPGVDVITGLLLECKAFNPTKHMKIIKDGPPFEILAQMHFGLAITELKAARLLLYNPDIEAKYALHIIEVKANRAITNNFKRLLLPQPVGS